MLSDADNEILTRTGPGTPMGDFFRCYWIPALLAVMFILIYLPVVRAEEAFLRATFPEFEAYSSAVPRFFPRFSAFGGNHGTFSWDLYCKHREYNAVVGTAFMLAAVTAKLLWWTG